jgi:hypothetical protein
MNDVSVTVANAEYRAAARLSRATGSGHDVNVGNTGMVRKVAKVHVVGEHVEQPSLAIMEIGEAEAETWGSASTSRSGTLSPKAAERLTAVVAYRCRPSGC